MAALEASVSRLEETLHLLSDEQLSGQLAIIKVSVWKENMKEKETILLSVFILQLVFKIGYY